MYDEHNNVIKWSYFEELVKVQNNEKLHVGCRATNRHLNWKREKMRVKLAAQTLSESTARGMEYLRKSEYELQTEIPHSTNENQMLTNQLKMKFINLFKLCLEMKWTQLKPIMN